MYWRYSLYYGSGSNQEVGLSNWVTCLCDVIEGRIPSSKLGSPTSAIYSEGSFFFVIIM